MGRAISMVPGSEDVRRKLEQAQRNLEQLKYEEENRQRRIARRKGRQESRRIKPQSRSNWWLKPFLSGITIVGLLILIAWFWPLVQKFLQ